ANSWFSNAAGTARPYRNRNQYGFKVGGPILKNRLFFFVYAEKLNDIVTASKLVTVLTPTARLGTFRYTVGGVTYGANLFTAGGFTVGASGNAVPTGISSLVNSQILAALPAGNSSETGDLLNTMGYRFSQHNDQTRKSFTSRVDYDLNSKNNINAVLDYQFENNLRGDLDTVNLIPKVHQPAKPIVYSGGWRFSPSANISNELRVGRFYSAPVFLSDIIRSEWETVPLFTNVDPLNGAAIFRNQGRVAKNWNIQDTVSWLTGNHAFRFGAQYQYVHIDSFNDAGNLPTYGFGLSANGPVIQPTALAVNACGSAATCPLSATLQTNAKALFAVLGGVLSGGSLTFNPTDSTSGFVNGATSRALFKYSMIAPYAVDQWKIRPDLTLNLGLRWDYQTPLESENQLFFEPVVNGDPVAATLDPAGSYQIIGGNAGHKGWFYKRDLNNWAPSLGVAWAPRLEKGFLHKLTGDDFVIRGGYRRSYVNDELVRAPQNAFAGNAGLGATNGNALSCFTVGCTPNTTLIDDRFGAAHQSVINTPAFVSTRAYTTNNTPAVAGNAGTVFTIDPKLQTPDQNDYSFGIQRRFGRWVAEVRYVGGFSHNMLRTIDYNQVMVPTQYKADFNTVRANVLAGCPAANGGLVGSAQACANGAPLFNSMVGFGGVTGSLSGTNLTTNTLGTLTLQGQMAELIWQQLLAANIPNPNVSPVPAGALRSQFLPNPNTGVANVLGNGGHYLYNAGVVELRRQFSQGLYLQANYTFSKELTDAIGTGQTRVEPFLDNANQKLDYTRADYDQTHVFNVNAIYELPFGKGRRFLNENSWLDYAIGGWQVGVVWRLASGAPLTITDARGTLNRTGRSARQTALTSLTEQQLRKAVGVFKTPCGVYWINPQYLNINQAALAAGNCSAVTSGVPTVSILGSTATTTSVGGAGASGFGIGAWGPNQVFFNNGPGQTSGLRRAFFNGPVLSSADLSIIKNFKFRERITFQVRGEMFNFLNTPYFAPTQFGTSFDINNTNFGKVTGVSVGARVVQFAGRLSF
ncbi:MAG: TonB-dependent receptor, partial [Acidobacteriota bacterium]